MVPSWGGVILVFLLPLVIGSEREEAACGRREEEDEEREEDDEEREGGAEQRCWSPWSSLTERVRDLVLGWGGGGRRVVVGGRVDIEWPNAGVSTMEEKGGGGEEGKRGRC